MKSRINILAALQRPATLWDDVLVNIAALLVMGSVAIGTLHLGVRSARQLHRFEGRARNIRRGIKQYH